MLIDLLGDRGNIDLGITDLGITRDATVEDAILCVGRRKKHRMEILNEVVAELDKVRRSYSEVAADVTKWRGKSGFKVSFSSTKTWMQIREPHSLCPWAKGIWFSLSTPKFVFIAWLAILDRLSTMDRVVKWGQGVDTTCVLCKNADETRDHIFFECSYSSQLWEHLVKGILGNDFSNSWRSILSLISDSSIDTHKAFCLRYAFHAAVYGLWRERNRVKHGEKAMSMDILQKLIDKEIRNKLSLVGRDKWSRRLAGIIQFWFLTRI